MPFFVLILLNRKFLIIFLNMGQTSKVDRALIMVLHQLTILSSDNYDKTTPIIVIRFITYYVYCHSLDGATLFSKVDSHNYDLTAKNEMTLICAKTVADLTNISKLISRQTKRPRFFGPPWRRISNAAVTRLQCKGSKINCCVNFHMQLAVSFWRKALSIQHSRSVTVSDVTASCVAMHCRQTLTECWRNTQTHKMN